MKIYRAGWIETKSEQQRQQMRTNVRQWHADNIERKRVLDKNYHTTQQYKDTQNRFVRIWKRKNKHKVAAVLAKRRATILRAVPIWFEPEQVDLLYKKAQ